MNIQIQIPDSTGLKGIDPDYIKRMMAATLYHIGRISEWQACELAGQTRREFECLTLPEFGFSVMADDQGTIDVELSQ